ncbi:MAG: alpha/beta fold hydrolase, partial [bacterium]
MRKVVSAAIAFLLIISPLALLYSEEAKDEINKPKKLTITLKSGINIVGTLYEPREVTSLNFVLLHGLGSTRHEWTGFAEKLHTMGYGVFMYDARGHGESVLCENGTEINYKSFTRWGKTSPWMLMIDDLDEILIYLEKLVGLDPKRFVLGGASLGANVALNCASRKKDLRGLILLSPGLDYAGVTTEYPMRFCKVPAIAIAASPGDAY